MSHCSSHDIPLIAPRPALFQSPPHRADKKLSSQPRLPPWSVGLLPLLSIIQPVDPRPFASAWLCLSQFNEVFGTAPQPTFLPSSLRQFQLLLFNNPQLFLNIGVSEGLSIGTVISFTVPFLGQKKLVE